MDLVRVVDSHVLARPQRIRAGHSHRIASPGGDFGTVLKEAGHLAIKRGGQVSPCAGRGWLATIATLTAEVPPPGAAEPLDCDEAAYGYMGRRMAAGAVLYKDLTEYKPPG